MRIRKLAKELECSSEQLLALLHTIGHARYRDEDQQLPDPVVTLVRRNALSLKQGRAWRPPENEQFRRLDGPARPPAPSPEDSATLAAHLAGVRPIAPPAPAPKPVKARPVTLTARAAPVAPLPVAPVPVAPVPVPRGSGSRAPAPPAPVAPALAPRAPVAPVVAPLPPGAFSIPEAPASAPVADLMVLREELGALRGERAAIASERQELAAERAELRAERDSLRQERDAALAAARSATERAELAEAELSRRPALSPEPAAPSHTPVRTALEARGLRGDDEMGRALAALVEGRRVRELLDALPLAADGPLLSLLEDRLLLVAAGEDVPTGLVGAPVAQDRSESPSAGPIRNGVARVSTALLVHGLRRLVVIGGTSALHRVLHDAVDPRIELRVHPTPGPESAFPDVPAGAVIALWGDAADERRLSERFPTAARVRSREIVRLCAGLVEHIERM